MKMPFDICHDCFACKQDYDGQFGCVALDIGKFTLKDKTCAFHKTSAEQRESIAKAKDRQLKVYGTEIYNYAAQLKGAER